MTMTERGAQPDTRPEAETTEEEEIGFELRNSISIDIGGTFTDCFVVYGDRTASGKAGIAPGCGATHFLEIDHWRLDFARGGLTVLDNLCRLCSVHHKMKTNGLLRLGGGPGRWYVIPRAGP
jgi:hypothetical protein